MFKELVIEGEEMGVIAFYKSLDGKTTLDFKLENDSVWLTQAQMSTLFGKDQSVIARHIKNALYEGGIEQSNMQILHNTLSKYRPTTIYNLDIIISVGYRVHSSLGVHFRRWASTILKDYLIKGYAIKSNIYKERYYELRSLVDIMGRTMQYDKLNENIKSIFDVITDYTYALDILDLYDYQTLEVCSTFGEEKFRATYENAMEVINKLKNIFVNSDLFGHEKDDSFKSSIGQIYQTWEGKEL